MTKVLERLKSDLGTQEELIQRWKMRAEEIRMKAHGTRDELSRQLMIMHAEGIEECATDIQLYLHLTKLSAKESESA